MNKPREPIKPSELKDYHLDIYHKDFYNKTFAEILEECRALGYKGKLEDLRMEYSSSECGNSYYEDDYDYSHEKLYIIFLIPNVSYEKDLIKYEKDLQKYNIALETYNKWLINKKPKELQAKKNKLKKEILLARKKITDSELEIEKLSKAFKELEELS